VGSGHEGRGRVRWPAGAQRGTHREVRPTVCGYREAWVCLEAQATGANQPGANESAKPFAPHPSVAAYTARTPRLFIPRLRVRGACAGWQVYTRGCVVLVQRASPRRMDGPRVHRGFFVAGCRIQAHG
jgi:hypothetical protein